MNAVAMNLVIIAVFFGMMYFTIIRPQKKQAEKKREMLDNMRPGNQVMTIGGLYGILDEVNGDKVVIDCEGIYLTFAIHAIAEVKSTEFSQDPEAKRPDQPVTDVEA